MERNRSTYLVATGCVWKYHLISFNIICFLLWANSKHYGFNYVCRQVLKPRRYFMKDWKTNWRLVKSQMCWMHLYRIVTLKGSNLRLHSPLIECILWLWLGKKLIAKAFLFLNRRRFVTKYLSFGKMGYILLQMILSLRYVLEKITFFYHWCTLYRTRSVLGRNQNCTSSSFQRLRWNSDTALQQMRQKVKCKMRISDALLLHVLLIHRFLGVFLSSFCFYFLYFFLVAVFNFLTHALYCRCVRVLEQRQKFIP